MNKKLFDYIYSGLILIGCFTMLYLFGSCLSTYFKNVYNDTVIFLEESADDKISSVQKDINILASITQLIFDQEIKKPSYSYLKAVSVLIIQKTILSEEEKISISLGSGTIIADKNGYFYILTNRHVCGLENLNGCYLINKEDNREIPLEFVKESDQTTDLALWRVTNNLRFYAVMKGFRKSYVTQRAFSVGQYLGIPYTYSEGTKSNIMDDYDMFNMPTAPGCSGSGIFDKDGYMIAVIVAGNTLPVINFSIGRTMDTSKAIAINLKTIEAFLKDAIN